MKKEDKLDFADATEQMNKDLLKARKGKPPGKRLGLIVHESGGIMVIDVTNLEVFYGDLTKMTIQAEMVAMIEGPLHAELHNVIRGFTENNLDEIISAFE